MYNMYEVKNPVYQDYKDIQKDYDENLIVLTNVNWGKHGDLIGGIVRYYGDDRKSLINKWGEFINSDKEDEYGKCYFTTLIRDRGVHYDFNKYAGWKTDNRY